MSDRRFVVQMWSEGGVQPAVGPVSSGQGEEAPMRRVNVRTTHQSEKDIRTSARYTLAAVSKKRAIRFAVVHPDTGGHSGVWRVWAHGDDVYLAPSEHAGTYKVSLHPNVYRVAFTREHWATGEVPNNAPGPGRAMVEYLPTERDEGVEYAWMVGFQPDALLDTRELESNVVRIVAPDVHHIVQVDLWICEPSVTRRPEFAVDPVPLQLDDGRILWVGYHAYVPANESDYMPGRTDYVGSMAEFSDRVAPTSAPGFVIRPVDVA